MKYQVKFRQCLVVCLLLLCCTPTISNALDRLEIEKSASMSMVFINTNNGIGNGFFVAPNLIVTGAHLVENLRDIRIQGYVELEEIKLVEIVDILPEYFLAFLRVDTAGWVPPFADSETIYPNDEVYVASAASVSQGPVVEIKRVRGSTPADYCQIKMKLPLVIRNGGGLVVSLSGGVVGIHFAGWALEAKSEFKFSFVVPIKAVQDWIENGRGFEPSIPLTSNFCKNALRNILKGNAAARKAIWLEKARGVDKHLRIPGDSLSRYQAAARKFFGFVSDIPWKKIRQIFL